MLHAVVGGCGWLCWDGTETSFRSLGLFIDNEYLIMMITTTTNVDSNYYNGSHDDDDSNDDNTSQDE